MYTHYIFVTLLDSTIITGFRCRKQKEVRNDLKKKCFIKLKGKDGRKSQLGNHSNFMNYNLSSLCMVAVFCGLNLHSIIKIQ